LDDGRKTRIKELGFEGMLSLKPIEMRENLLNCLIQLYNPLEERFIFGTGESFTLYAIDVELIMDLKDEGITVQVDENIDPEDVPDMYKTNHCRGVIRIPQLVRNIYAEGPPNEEFDRSFVLFLLATILAPVHMEHVPISYYSLVKDVSRIKNMNWNAFTLKFLMDNLKDVHYDRRLLGNVALMEVI
jgi:hypothetical protein